MFGNYPQLVDYKLETALVKSDENQPSRKELNDKELFESYVKKNAKAGSAEFNQIMSEMTYKTLDSAFAGRDLTAVTEDEIEAILRENGVVNGMGDNMFMPKGVTTRAQACKILNMLYQ